MGFSRRTLVGLFALMSVTGSVALVVWPDKFVLIGPASPFVVPQLSRVAAPVAVTNEDSAVAQAKPNRVAIASGDPLRVLVGPDRAVSSLALAARVAPDGAVLEVDPGDYLADVAVWEQQHLTIRGTGPGVRLIASGHSAEGKAIWVIRRGRFVVENIEFIGARVADRNGAGIRLEGGQLLVRNCRFFDSESGILTGAGEGMRLEVENSEFSHHGAGDGRSHALYVGAIGYFRLSGSHVHHANVGHLVKSRARRSRIEYNRLTDEDGGRASYELEFPNGGEVEVVGNVVQQGPDTRNPVMLSFGVEGYRWPANRLLVGSNTFVNDRSQGGSFMFVAPGAAEVVSMNNLLVGPGGYRIRDRLVKFNDVQIDRTKLGWAPGDDFRLRSTSPDYVYRQPADQVWAEALRLHQQYVHPRTTRRVEAPPRFVGADQRSAP